MQHSGMHMCQEKMQRASVDDALHLRAVQIWAEF